MAKLINCELSLFVCPCVFFATMINESPFTHRALKLMEFANKTAPEKKKLLAKDLGTSIEICFHILWTW